MARLLVSDDDPHILELLSLVLEDAGHEVLKTTDPREVLSLASQPGIDAIILDVVMPEISGYQVLSELRENPLTATLPILFLSGLGDGEDRVRGLRHGADDYLTKPFEPDELVLRVERLISWRGRERVAASPPAARGSGFGRYEVVEVLGKGAMGTVYRGWDPRLQRAVALKTVRFESGTTEELRRQLLARLQKEAITVAKFSHPNIVAVYDMGDASGSAFIAMELIDGMSLAEFLDVRGPLVADKVIPLGLHIAGGLAMAHSRAVIHRDVKPSNVLLGREGSIKVTDFGLAHLVSAITQEAASNTHLYGTPGYVPPEVLNDEPYTREGDIFGFGATLYESLTGHHPLIGDSLKDTILNTMEGRVQPLAELVPGIPAELAELVMRLLAVEPEDRPSAVEALEMLQRLAAERRLRWRPNEIPAASG